MSDESTPQVPQPSEMALLRTEMRTGFQSVGTHMTRTEEETRRHIDVTFEALRAEFQVVIDAATDLDEKVDRLIASNAAEHAAFLQAMANLRSQRLEKAADPAPSAGDR